MRRPGALPYLVLAAGVLITSTASILIRFAQAEGVPSLSIAAGRLAIAALLLTPVAWSRAGADLRRVSRSDLLLAAGSGVFLAIHFATWISSLAYTSVASSVALVSTNPLWAGLASLVILRERLRGGTLAGILLTLGGTALILVSDSGAEAAARHPAPLLGNLLALIGALAVTGYFLIGRALRQRLSLLAYIWLVYGTAALTLVMTAAATGRPLLGFSPLAWLCIVGLALGPQLLGHSSFNWALRFLSATFVAVATLGEPVGSALLALAFFGESFAPLQLAGFVLLLAGIYAAARSEQPDAGSPEEARPAGG
ncbi:MAG TPA: DMT family transporter [Thermoanaerobaculia bacterium]|nr:DMT family transporter [Thermoanaerobaculia bacterium]